MAYPYQLLDLSDACSQWGISEVVFCPGSRNAPLGLAFHRNPNLQVYSIIDERSAGFFALGLAQKSQKPVIICCTSGSALMNFGPAIVEAFFCGSSFNHHQCRSASLSHWALGRSNHLPKGCLCPTCSWCRRISA